MSAKNLHISLRCKVSAVCGACMQAMREVLPILQCLSEDVDHVVQVEAIQVLVQLLPQHGSHLELAGRLYSHLDELVTNNQPQVRKCPHDNAGLPFRFQSSL